MGAYSILTLVFATLIERALGDPFYVVPPGSVANATNSKISPGCVGAVEAAVNCNPYISSVTQGDTFANINKTYHDSICTTACGSALTTYRNNVTTSCRSDPQIWQGRPSTYFGDMLSASYNLTCLKDTSSGQYCVDYIANTTAYASLSSSSGLLGLSTAQACSPCIISVFRQIQSTPFSNYDPSTAALWTSLQSKCSLSYPTIVQNLTTNVSSVAGYADPGYVRSTTCLSGKNYTVVGGDSCGKIAQAQNVSTGALLAVNNIPPDCTTLQVGQKLCLPQACRTYTVKSNDTCSSIAGAQNLTFTQLLAWNPSINQPCTNLIAGTNICLSIPGGATYTPTTISGAPSATQGTYATTTAIQPSPVPSGTTANCGQYYNVRYGDYCQVIALNNTITLSLFQAINPSINSNCSNLVVGFNYCVLPTRDWNVTATNSSTTLTYASPGAPTPSGTTNQCYKYYTIVSGDTCYGVEQQFGITMNQLMAWNPSLASDCSNLILGDAYCVSGPAVLSSTTTTTTTSTTKASSTSSASQTYVSPPAPTPSGTTSKCTKWYTVQSGDYCDKIDQQFGITLAQFQSWNPSINSGCSNLIVGDAYCVAGPSSATSKARFKRFLERVQEENQKLGKRVPQFQLRSEMSEPHGHIKKHVHGHGHGHGHAHGARMSHDL